MDDVDRAERAAAEAEARVLSGRFMWGELCDCIVDELKRQVVPWGAIPESQQNETIQRIGERVRKVTIQAIDIIAGANRPTVTAEVAKVTFGNGIQVALKLSKLQPDRHAIADATGRACLLVLPEYDYILDGDAPRADSDQLRLAGLEENPDDVKPEGGDTED